MEPILDQVQQICFEIKTKTEFFFVFVLNELITVLAQHAGRSANHRAAWNVLIPATALVTAIVVKSTLETKSSLVVGLGLLTYF